MKMLFRLPVHMGVFFLLLCGCGKEDGDLDPENTETATSQLVDNSGWQTYALDEDFFFGQPGRSGLYEYEYVLGDVKDGKPSFMAWSNIYALGSAGPTPKLLKWKVVDEGSILTVDGWNIGIWERRLNNRESGGSGLPQNLSEHDQDGLSYTATYKPYFYQNEPYAARNYFSKVSSSLNGSWRSTRYRGAANNTKTIGWTSHISPVFYQPDIPSLKGVGMSNTPFGEPDMMSLNGKDIVVSLAAFLGEDDNHTGQGVYSMLAGKEFEGVQSDTLELGSNVIRLFTGNVVPNSVRVKCIQNQCLGTVIGEDGTASVLWGNFENGIKEVIRLSDAPLGTKIIKGENEFYVVLERGGDASNAYRIDVNGAVTQLTDVPDSYLDFVAFEGNLIVAYSDEGDVIKLAESTENGLKPFGIETITKPLNRFTNRRYGSPSLTFATDGTDLFAAIKNNVNAKYAGAEQWTGWEIIKYNN